MKSCPHRLRTYKKCGCPIWVQGTLHDKWLKKSLDLRNWESAQKLVRDWESGHSKALELSSVTKACDAFIRDCEARELSSASVGKYKLLAEELKKHFEGRSVATLSVDEVRRYRETWDQAPISARKKLERLRTFFRFCIENQWMHTNLPIPQKRSSTLLHFTALLFPLRTRTSRSSCGRATLSPRMGTIAKATARE